MGKVILGLTKSLDGFAENYEYQVPIFIFTDKIPDKHPKETDMPLSPQFLA